MLNLQQKDIRYEIDDQDRIIFVNRNWTPFAQANQAVHLAEGAVLQCSIWDFISGEETRLIYEALLAKVRQSQQPVLFSYRCDTLTLRRWLWLELQPQADEHILFLSRVFHQEARAYVPLLDTVVPRSPEFLTICSWCKQVELRAARWVEVEVAVEELGLFMQPMLPQLSHGICPTCLQALQQEIATYAK